MSASPTFSLGMDKLPVIAPQDLGLKIFHNPLDVDEVEIDIVAVHGIGADPKTTWVHSKTQVNWISDPKMLPASFPAARIMAFGYNSIWFGKDAVRQSLESLADKLLKALVRERDGCPQRPIIFIAHCFGGLIIQRAYTIAALHTTHYPNLARSIQGMVFLGTPHHGLANNSSLGSQSQVYAAIVAAKVHVEDNVLLTLVHNNDVLVSAVHGFTRTINERKPAPRIFCFYEQKATNVGAIIAEKHPLEFVVDETSATLTSYEKEGLPLDHFGMNKFESVDNENYQCVLYQIKKMEKEATRLIDAALDFLIDSRRSRRKGTEKSSQSAGVENHIGVLPALNHKHANFAARGGILERIDERLSKKPKVALYGAMGNGKTHVAAEYAYKYHKETPQSRVFWVDASTAEDFELSYRRIGISLRIPSETAGHEKLFSSIKTNLEDEGQCLMVLDGLDDDESLISTDHTATGQPKSLLGFLPVSSHARVLITTRSRQVAFRLLNEKAKYVLPVDSLGIADVSRLFLQRETKDPNKQQWLEDMVNVLGDSAGALELARLCWKVSGKSSLQELLKTLRSSGRANSKAAHPAWNVIFGVLKSQHPELADWILTISLLDVEMLPTVLFSNHEKKNYITTLTHFGIMEAFHGQRFYRIPALFRRYAQDWLAERQTKTQHEAHILHTILTRWKDDKFRIALLPCALAAVKLRPSCDAGKRALEALHSAISKHSKFGQRKGSPESLEMTLVKAASDLDLKRESRPADTDISRRLMESPGFQNQPLSLSVQGSLLSDNGPSGYEEVGCRKHAPSSVSTAADLARIRATMRATSERAAQMLFHGKSDGSEDAVILYRRVINDSQDDTKLTQAKCQYNLALALGARGDFEEAEQAFLSALEKVKPNTDSVSSPNEAVELLYRIYGGLAGTYASNGKLEKAEEIFHRVLPKQIQALGPEHPLTLSMRHDLALLFRERGNFDGANQALRDVLAAQKRVLGEGHRDTLITACSLAGDLPRIAKLEDGERTYLAVLKEQEKSLGESHRDTAATRRMLSELRQQSKV